MLRKSEATQNELLEKLVSPLEREHSDLKDSYCTRIATRRSECATMRRLRIHGSPKAGVAKAIRRPIRLESSDKAAMSASTGGPQVGVINIININ